MLLRSVWSLLPSETSPTINKLFLHNSQSQTVRIGLKNTFRSVVFATAVNATLCLIRSIKIASETPFINLATNISSYEPLHSPQMVRYPKQNVEFMTPAYSVFLDFDLGVRSHPVALASMFGVGVHSLWSISSYRSVDRFHSKIAWQMKKKKRELFSLKSITFCKML